MPLRSIARLGVVEFVEEGRDVSSFMKGMAHWRPFEASPVRRLYNIITSSVWQVGGRRYKTGVKIETSHVYSF